MSTTMSTPGNILLDAGSNELEILVFKLSGGWYGVNVAKVREVILPVKAMQTPGRHESIIGVFNIRGAVVPLIDLRFALGLTSTRVDDASDGRIIITEFNGVRLGFHVDEVDQIHRITWEIVKPAPEFNGSQVGVITGVVEFDEKLVLMIDFESVADAINMEEKLHIGAIENELGVDRAAQRVILAEDSPFMRERMRSVFLTSGYSRIEVYSDGEQAWEAISAPGDPIAAIVSDIEMPRMDGLHLTKRIREHHEHSEAPVLLFSSLISDDNKKKGQQVGATIQMAKPELAELVRLVDQLIADRDDAPKHDDTLDNTDSAAGTAQPEAAAA